MAQFVYWLVTVPFLIVVVVWDMIMATMGKSKMDKFKREWYDR